MTECNSMECSTQSDPSCGPAGQECPCGGQGCPGCNPNVNPLDFMTMMWQKATFEAMFEVKKEKVKEKIIAAYGDVIDKGAQASVEALGKKITSMMDAASSQEEFRNKIASLMNEAKRK